jgi:putative PIN family toxin of toxin-antitoxin system
VKDMDNKKVVLDTNLWISFLISKRLDTIDELLLREKITLLFSAELIEEFIKVSSRPKFKKYFAKEDIRKLLSFFDIYGKLIRINSSVKICRDIKDNFLLNLAIDGKADFLVTGDVDLLSLKEIENIPILTFNQLMTKIS